MVLVTQGAAVEPSVRRPAGFEGLMDSCSKALTTLWHILQVSRPHVCALPPQLLALVLARLDPAERLGSMARVCSAWRTAAVMATNNISVRVRAGLTQSGISQDKATALSDWLQAHAAAAALDSLAVEGDAVAFSAKQLSLQLPVQQLQSLRSLDLRYIRVNVQHGASTQAALQTCHLSYQA